MTASLQKLLLISSLTAMIWLAGCDDRESARSDKGQSVLPAVSIKTALKNHAYLRQRLPAQTLAYLRIPDFWGMLYGTKGDIFHDAYAQDSLQAVVTQLRQGVRQVMDKHAQDPGAVWWSLWLQHVTGPLEFVLLTPDNNPMAMPSILLSTPTDFATAEQINAWFESAARQSRGMLTLQKPLAAQGEGLLLVAGMPIYAQFNNGRLHLFWGMAATQTEFGALINDLDATTDHAMHKLEAQIDTSGLGLFYWMDIQRIQPYFALGGNRHRLQKWHELGLDQARALAMGYGVSEKKGRLSIVLDMPQVGFRQYLPTASNQIQVKTSGVPTGMGVISIPSATQWQAMEQALMQHMSSKERKDFDELKNGFSKVMGSPLEDWLAALGSELMVVSDNAGDYLALRIRDNDKWQAVLKAWKQKEYIKHESRQVNGQTIQHVALGSMLLDQEQLQKLEQESKGALWFLPYMMRPRDHLYWLEQDNYLIIAGVPQVLMERQRQGVDIALQDWLSQSQRLQTGHSLLMFAGKIDKLPQRLYYAMLEVLNMLADIVDTKIDLYALPTAQDINLPQASFIALQLRSSEDQLALELSFEHNPAEVLLGGGGMATVAVVGILAAIAIPAYQDYTLRANVSNAMAEAYRVKAMLAQFHNTHGRFPNDKELEQLSLRTRHRINTLEVEPDTGVIVVTLTGPGQLRDKSLYLVPQSTGGHLQWSCTSDEIEQKHLPGQCR